MTEKLVLNFLSLKTSDARANVLMNLLFLIVKTGETRWAKSLFLLFYFLTAVGKEETSQVI